MLYKAFAAITLIAAPIIVLIAQSVAPQSPAPHPSSAIQPPVQQQAPMMQPPITAAPLPTSDPTPFGQPMPDAGKPFLTPGNGLPGAAPTEEGIADNGASTTTGTVSP